MRVRARRTSHEGHKLTRKITFIACLVTLTYVRLLWYDVTQLEEPALRECVSFWLSDKFPMQSPCTVDAIGFPVIRTNIIRQSVVNPGSDRYQLAFLHVSRENMSSDLFGPLQYLARTSESLTIVLSADDSILFSDASPTLDYITKKADVLEPAIGTREWWAFMLNSTGVQLSRIVWNQDKSQLLLRTVTGVSHDACQCSKLVEDNLEFQRRYSSCAIVMNSGLMGKLRQLRTGAAIDSHEAVFRLNAGPSGGFYAHIVGSRTTFRLMYPTTSTLHTFGDEVMLYSVYRSSERRLLKQAVRQNRFLPSLKVKELRKPFRDCAKRCMNLPERHASTGILAVVLALTMCERITVFGKSLRIDSFDLTKFSYHYFEQDNSSHIDDMFSRFHRPDLESKFYQELAQLGVTFVP